MGWLIFIAIVIYIIYSSSKSGATSKSQPKSQYSKSYAKTIEIPNKKLNEDRVYIENIELSDEQQKLFHKIENSKIISS